MRHRVATLLLAVTAVVVCTSASAVTRTWTGASTANWSNGGNWSPPGAPAAGEDLVFPNGTPATMTNDLAAGFTVGALTFGTTDGNITLGGNALTLTGSITFTGGGFPHFICNVPLKIGAPLHLGNAIVSTYNGAIDVNGQTLTIDSYNTTLAGAVNGSGSIVVSGVGINLNSSGNFSGTISGSVNVNGSNPNMNKSGAGLLAGNGTLGTLTTPAGGNDGWVAPGPQDPCCADPHVAGTLHTQSLSLAGRYYIDLVPGGTSDSLQVTGTVTVGGTLIVAIPSGAPVPGQAFTIVDNDGSDPVSGTFAGLPEGATMTAGAATLAISYHGGDGNDVVLTTLSTLKTWTGAISASWSDPGNWSPAAIPTPGEALVFPNGSRATMTNDLAAGFTVGALTFGTTDGNITLGGNALTLTGSITFTGGGFPHFICNVPLKIGAPLHLGNAIVSTYNGAIDVNGQTLTIDSYNTTLAGAVNGSGSIVVSGVGINLNSSGTFSGTISGSVNVNGSNPNMNKSGPGLLAGTGTLGTVTTPGGGSDGWVAPGPQDPCCADPHVSATLHTQALSLAGRYYVDLVPAGVSDSLQVTGTVTVGGTLIVTIPSGAPSPGQSFTVIDNDGSDPVNGTFAGLPEGASIAVGPATLLISYHGGDGNDVVLTALSNVKSWTGAISALWSNPGNWSPAAIPIAGEDLVFPNGSRTTMTNDLAPGFTVGALTFGTTDGNITLDGNALTLIGSITFTGGGFPHFICNVPLKIGAPLHFGNAIVSTYNGAIDVNGQTLVIDSYNTTLAGAVNGSGAIVITGAGINLNSSGNFSGTISGSVNVNGSNPNMNKSGPGLLMGSGTLGTVTAPSHLSRVMPGTQDPCCADPHTVGTLHTQSLSLADSYYVDLVPGATSDSLQVTGTVTLGGTLVVTIPSGAPTPGQQFTIIDNDGSDPVVSAFTGLPEGALIGQPPFTVRISYHGGDGNDVVLTAVALTTTALEQSSPSGVFGTSVTFTATVSSNYGSVPGSVAFYDGATLLGTAPIQAGVASFTTSALGGGTHSITASYGGGDAFALSVSSPLSHEVQKGTATLSLTPSKLSLTFGDSLTLTASLTPVAPSTASPTGSVTFNADGSALGPAAIVNGQAALLTSTLAAGTHALTASYPGDANYNSASTPAPISVTVAKAPTTLDVHSLHNPSRGDESVVLQVTVGVVNPQTPISGIITVSENGQPLAQQVIAAGNSASVSFSGLASGTHQLAVTFTGENFLPSSQSLVQTVLPPSVSPGDVSVVEGNSGTKVVSIAVHLSVRSSQPVSVQYRSQDGSAKAGEDYLAVDGTLTFAPGETGKNIDVTIVGDTTTEHDESFHVLLSNATNATLEGGPATVTIVNDDPWFKTTTFTYAPQRTLDVDTPIFGNGPFPAIVWVGGATSYSPGGDSPALRETERGYVVVIPTYRTPDQARFPAQLDDLKAAIAWIRANASTLNVDPLHIGVWGGGAGAQLASLAGVTGAGLQAVVDWGGPTDLLKLQSDATASCVGSYDDASSAPSQLIGCALQTCPASANAASPLSSVTFDDAPILIIHGAADCVVPAEQSRRFFAALQAVHVDATLHIVDNLGAFGPSWDAAVSHAEVDAFLDAHLKGTTSKRRGVSH